MQDVSDFFIATGNLQPAKDQISDSVFIYFLLPLHMIIWEYNGSYLFTF